MARFKVVQEFEAGANIPDWLLEIEPQTKNSVRGEVTFFQPVIILETEKRYIIVPENGTDPIISIKHSQENKFSAAVKDVAMGIQWNVFRKVDVNKK